MIRFFCSGYLEGPLAIVKWLNEEVAGKRIIDWKIITEDKFIPHRQVYSVIVMEEVGSYDMARRT